LLVRDIVKSRVLMLAAPITLIGVLTDLQMSSSQNIKQQSNQEFKSQAPAQVHDSVQEQEPPIQEKVKVTGMDEGEVKSFFEAIQNAVKQNDATALSLMISYPLTLRDIEGHSVKVRNSKNFIANYPNFASSNWRGAVMRQKYEQLFSNWQGLMIGRGEIWFNGICRNQSCSQRELKITGINPWFAD
jgi:hypothetical protein